MRPIVIGIGGAHSGVGKTTYASLVLQNFPGWGAIKYTKTELYCSLTDDLEILGENGKDTKRMLASGAERVLWVQSPPSELGEALPAAVDRLSDLKGIVVEGNSAIEFLRPDIIIFIFGSDPGKIKVGAKGTLGKADIVVLEGEIPPELPGGAKIFRKSPDDYDGFLENMTKMVDAKEKIRSSLKDNSVRGKIPCPVARRIAEELNVRYEEIGKVADELGIKITDCELGCF
jgi:hypothetical protein